MSDENALLISNDGPIRHLRFNRPFRLNAIDLEQHQRVIRAVGEAEEDPQVRVIAFSGEGRAFCSGDDMKAQERNWPERYGRHQVDLEIGIGPLLLQEATTVIRNVSKPTAILMHGYCVGAGYDYATSCDFRLATEDCQFGDPRVHRALWAAEGWSYKISRLMPLGRVAPVALLGRLLTGAEALKIGLVHETFPPSRDLRESAGPYLERLASLDAECYAWTKRKLLSDLDLGFDTALANFPPPASKVGS